MQDPSNLDSKALQDAVVADFRTTGSLEATADHLNLSAYKVRKILITAGEWSSPFSEKVRQMMDSGLTITDISQRLDVSANLVSAYLPYAKTIYKVTDRTLVAGRSDRYRKRNRVTANRAENLRKGLAQILHHTITTDMMKGDTAMMKSSASQLSDRKLDVYLDRPIRLRLVLEDPYLDEDEKRILKKYGNSSTGNSITRDILIPADMTLHALHYAIQRLFGWQNSHLRSFELPEDIFDQLTDGTVNGWRRFIGVLFRFTMKEDDRFWDENYSSGSINTWLRKKYTGPYIFRGSCERYPNAQKAIQSFFSRHRVVEVHAGFDSPEMEAMRKNRNGNEPFKQIVLRKAPVQELTLEELNNSIILEESQNSLMERLLIRDVLAPSGYPLAGKDDYFVQLEGDLPEGFSTSKLPGQQLLRIKADKPAKPVTDTLYYEYDFGDGWRIEIARLDDFSDLLTTGRLSATDLEKAELTVIYEHKPVCIARDGIHLLDDVGGMSGFVNFLRTIHEDPDMEERISTLEWATSLGWNKRKVSL